jgi:hypothetical protein
MTSPKLRDDEGSREALEPTSPGKLARPAVAAGRLGTYTLLGGMAGTVPLPWVPDVVSRRIRGALVHDIAQRHGLSLAPEARAIFAEPSGGEGPRGILRSATEFVAGKLLARIGPLGMLAPLRSAVGTFVLGHLFHRYLGLRRERAVRIDIEEARRVRSVIERAMIDGLTGPVNAAPEDRGQAPEELRDSTTQLVDNLLIATAGLPGWLVRRLEAAFDDLVHREGLVKGYHEARAPEGRAGLRREV